MHKVLAVLAFAVATLAPIPAEAARWLRVESPLFVLYTEKDEQTARKVVQNLEAFDWMLRQLYGVTTPPDPSARKLDIYLLRDESVLREISPGMSRNVGGFYLARPDIVAAFVPFEGTSTRTVRVVETGSRLSRGEMGGLDSQDVLFHEYAHHFMWANMPGAYPRWWAEGFAEFVSTAEIGGDGIEVGNIPELRAAWLQTNTSFPLDRLLSPPENWTSADVGMFYARSWLFVHYLHSTPDLRQRRVQFLRAINRGEDQAAALESAFGTTVQQMDQLLLKYQVQTTLRGFVFPPAPRLANQQLKVSRLPDSMDSLMVPRLRALVASDKEEAAFLARVRSLAAPHRGDPEAAMTVAWAALAAEQPADAIAEMDAVLAASPENADALYLKGLALLHAARAENGPARAARVAEARRVLGRSNRLAPERMHVLFRYGQTFAGEPTTENTLNILRLALQLAPQVGDVRMTAASALLAAEEFDEAAKMLAPLAFAPHGGEQAELARKMRDAALRREQPPAESAAAE